MLKFIRHAAAPIAAAALALGGLLTACTPTQSKPAVPKSPPKQTPQNDLTQGLGLESQALEATASDPSHPGWALYKVSAQEGSLDLPNNAFYGKGLTALIYQHGRELQKITAPIGRADTKAETIHAYGGVVVTYLASPGSYLHADNVTWNAKSEQGVARGHVYFHYLQRKSVIAGTVPIAYFNTHAGVITSEPPTRGG